MYYIFVCICGMEATLSFFQCFLPSLFLFAWKLTQIHGFAPTLDGSHVYTSISAEIVLLVTVQDHTRKTSWKITWSTKPLRGKSSSLMMGDEPMTQSKALNQNSNVTWRPVWVQPQQRNKCQQQRVHAYYNFHVTQECSGDICDLSAGPGKNIFKANF